MLVQFCELLVCLGQALSQIYLSYSTLRTYLFDRLFNNTVNNVDNDLRTHSLIMLLMTKDDSDSVPPQYYLLNYSVNGK